MSWAGTDQSRLVFPGAHDALDLATHAPVLANTMAYGHIVFPPRDDLAEFAEVESRFLDRARHNRETEITQ